MSTVPSGTRFIGIADNVSLVERKSAVLNADTQPYTIEDLVDTIGVGAQGPQGVQGPAGPLGPVGPAGLNWQGSWVSETSYVADDAVGYDGASWFCILATSGTIAPDVDTTHWALLASQGAQGIQGVQGPTGPQGAGATQTLQQTVGLGNTFSDEISGDTTTIYGGAIGVVSMFGNAFLNPYELSLRKGDFNGFLQHPGTFTADRTYTLPNASGTIALTSDIVAPTQTNGIIYLTTNDSPTKTLAYDINRVNLTGNSTVRLPAAAPIGKQISVFLEVNSAANLSIYGDNVLNLPFPFLMGSANQQTGPFTIFDSESYVFTSLGSGLWKVNSISRTIMSGSAAKTATSSSTINGSNVTVKNTSTSDSVVVNTNNVRFEKNNSGVKTTIIQSNPTVSANRTITLPDASGTVALTTDVTLQKAVDGGNTITSSTGTTKTTLNGTSVSILDTNTLLGNVLYKDSLRFNRESGPDGATKRIDLLSPIYITDDRTITLPDASGTVALTSDVVASTLQQTINNGNTITDGYNTMTVTANSVKTNTSLGGQAELVGSLSPSTRPYLKFGLPASAGKTVTLTSADTQTASRTIKLPDASGTVALEDYKVFSALITQSGSDAPTAKVLKNTTGATFTYSKISDGYYGITASSDVFTIDKTALLYSLNSSGIFATAVMTIYESGPTSFVIETLFSGNNTDNIMKDTFIEIRIYN